MKILDRYIGRAVAFGVFGVLLLLLVLMGFFELLNELEEVGQGYTTAMAFGYVGLILPRYTYELFPVATLLGSLIGLGGLASHSELIAMRAAGVSLARILGAVLKTGALLLVLVVLVGEYLAPMAELQAQRMKTQAVSGQATLRTRFGFWSRSGDSIIHVGQVLPGSRLADVTLYEFGAGHTLRRAIHAGQASYEQDHWRLQQVRESEFSPQRVVTREQQSLPWKSLLEPGVLDVVVVKPQMLAAWDLWRYVGFLKQNGQDASTYEVAFWSKLVAPLVTLVMLFLSIPFVFGPLRSVGIGQRIFSGAIVGIVFYLLDKAFSQMAVVYGVNPLFAAAFPTLLFFAVALWSFRRVH